MVKYRVSFTIEAEKLFEIASKSLPIENLSVQEIHTTPPVPLGKTEKFDIGEAIAAKKSRKHAKPTNIRGPNLNTGLNGVIVNALKRRPHRPVELEPLADEAGYSKYSISSRMVYLHGLGHIEPVGDGTWRIKDAPAKREAAPRTAPNSGAEHNEPKEVAELE